MSDEHEYTTDKLSAALVAAQSQMTSVVKDREVNAGKYKYSYITLASVIDHVRKPLTDNGLWFVQLLEADEQGKYRLVTRLTHSSGQYIESRTPMFVSTADNQQFGSALSYMRRYSLIALLGVAPDEDDDGNSADGKTVTATEKPKPLPRPTANRLNEDTEPEKPAGVASEMLEILNTFPDAKSANWCIANMKAKSWTNDEREKLWLALTARAQEVGALYNESLGQFDTEV